MAKSFDDLARRSMTPAMIRKGKAKALVYRRKMERDRISSTMKAIRKASGLSQKELAKILGIEQPTVARMETQGDIRLSTLIAFAQAAGGEMELTVRMPKTSIKVAI